MWLLIFSLQIIALEGLKYDIQNIYNRITSSDFMFGLGNVSYIGQLDLTQNADNLGFLFGSYGSLFGLQIGGNFVSYASGLQSTNNAFGSSVNYMAQLITNNIVTVAGIFNFSQNTQFCFTNNYTNNSTATSYSPPNQIYQSGFRVKIGQNQYYGLVAIHPTESYDTIQLFVFEYGSISIDAIKISQTNFCLESINGTYLFMMIGIQTYHPYYFDIQHLFEYFSFTALHDTLQNLTDVLSKFPSYFTSMLAEISAPFVFYGGSGEAFIHYTEGINTNYWLNMVGGGNIISNYGNQTGFAYSNNSITVDPNFGGNNYGQYFTYSQSNLFVAIIDLEPVNPFNNKFQVSFNLAQGLYSDCFLATANIILSNIVFRIQWMVHYGTCLASTPQPILNTVLIFVRNEVEDSDNLLNQSFQSSCDLNSPITKVNFPRQRVYYLMGMQNCTQDFDPSLHIDGTQDFIKKFLMDIEILNSCSHTCATCTNTSSSDCQSCNLYDFRTQIGSQCPCMNGYYDDGIHRHCKVCIYSCATCTSLIVCQTCNSTQIRSLQGTSCLCDDGYYDDGSNSDCDECVYTCETCSDDQNTCITCDSVSHRMLEGTFCTCSGGYYDNGIQSDCLTCNNTCQTCSSASMCVTCDSTNQRTLLVSYCTCNAGYYDDGLSAICQTCSYTCQTCANLNMCTTCNSTNNRALLLSNCTCNPGYFDDGSSAMCFACNYSCQSCSSTSKCITCSNGSQRSLRGSLCLCNDGYYDDGINAMCQKCNYSCQTCSSVIVCLSCVVQSNRSIQNSICTCNDGYYNDGINAVCQTCNLTCQTCLSLRQCLSCDQLIQRYLSVSKCICNDGYYDDHLITGCQSCNYTCKTCSSTSFCQSCIDGTQRSLSNQQCQCIDGYYDDNSSSVCQTCNNTCYMCSSATVCVSCDKKSKRQLIGVFCQCRDGYFDDEQQTLCQVCNYTCQTCSDALKCISCDTSIRTLNSNKCECKFGYLIVGNTCVISEQNTRLYISQDQDLNNNLRTAIIYYQKIQPHYNFSKLIFQIPGMNYQSDYFVQHQVIDNLVMINMTFNKSFNHKYLYILPSNESQIFTKQLQKDIPKYQKVSQQEVAITNTVLQSNSIFIYLMFIIMGAALLTGGFEMIFGILDLFQLFSYMKYINVQYPFNVNAYFDYMNGFNFQFLTSYLPFSNDFNQFLIMNYDASQLQAPYKIQQDGFSTFFMYNYTGILLAQSFMCVTYIGTIILVKVFENWNNLDKYDEYQGHIQQIYLLRFKISRFIVSILKDQCDTFFYSQIIRIFITTSYDLNFILFLELYAPHFNSVDPLLFSSSVLATLMLILQIYSMIKITNILSQQNSKQLDQPIMKRRIGSIIKEINMKKQFVKYTEILSMGKKILFMFGLIILYNHPVFQIGFLSILSLIDLTIYFISNPFKEIDTYYKEASCRFFYFINTCFIIIYAVDKDVNRLTDGSKNFIGWIIVSVSMLCLMIHIIIGIKQHIRLIIQLIKSLKKYINKSQKMRGAKQKIRKTSSIVVYDIIQDL